MGFRPKPNVYSITFEGLDGDEGSDEPLNIKAKSINGGQLKKMIMLASKVQVQGVDSSKIQLDDVAELIDDIDRMLADTILGWNLEDDAGEVRPTTVEGVSVIDFDLKLEIFGKIVEGIAGVSGPLKSQSSSGADGQAPENIPMMTNP
jgi:hypothetical protein